MKRLEFLITQVRQATDNKDTNGIPNSEIVGYFNDGQRYITSLIFKNNPEADLFKAQVVIAASSTGEYTIPSNCFSLNALSMVEIKSNTTANNGGYHKIKPIHESEAAYAFGYFTRDNKVIITGEVPHTGFTHVRITYFKQLPTVDIRRGRIMAPFTSTTFSVTGLDTEVFTMDDNFSTAYADGSQAVAGIYSASTTSPMTTTADKVAEMVASGSLGASYLVAGTDSANKSYLPDACETYLMDYVKQRIYTRNNYEDANKQMYFTEQQRSDIVAIFSKNKKDDDTIPLTDLTHLNF